MKVSTPPQSQGYFVRLNQNIKQRCTEGVHFVKQHKLAIVSTVAAISALAYLANAYRDLQYRYDKDIHDLRELLRIETETPHEFKDYSFKMTFSTLNTTL